MIIQDLFCCHFVCVFEAFSNRIFELFRCFHKMWETELSICQTLERTADFQIYNCLAENEMFPIFDPIVRLHEHDKRTMCCWLFFFGFRVTQTAAAKQTLYIWPINMELLASTLRKKIIVWKHKRERYWKQDTREKETHRFGRDIKYSI